MWSTQIIGIVEGAMEKSSRDILIGFGGGLFIQGLAIAAWMVAFHDFGATNFFTATMGGMMVSIFSGYGLILPAIASVAYPAYRASKSSLHGVSVSGVRRQKNALRRDGIGLEVMVGEDDRMGGEWAGRELEITWDQRPAETFSLRPAWEPEIDLGELAAVPGRKALHDVRLTVTSASPAAKALQGWTSSAVHLVDVGLDGAIWEDRQLAFRPRFVGASAENTLALGDEAIHIGPGFRFTVGDGVIYLDSRGPAALYGVEDLEAALAFVGKLETRLEQILAGPFAPATETPLPLMLHLYRKEPSEAGLEAIRERVFEGPEVAETAEALGVLLDRTDGPPAYTSALDGLLTGAAGAPPSEDVVEVILKRCDPPQDRIIAALAAVSTDPDAWRGGQRVLVRHLRDHGDTLAAQFLGAQLEPYAKAQAKPVWHTEYDQARLAIVSRQDGSDLGGLALVQEAGGGLALMAEDGLDRARATLESDREAGRAPEDGEKAP